MAAAASTTIAIKGEDKTRAAFRSVQGSVGKLKKSLGTLSVSIAGIGALGAGLGVATKKILDAADSIGKTATRIDISTDALQQFRYAAEQAGMTSGTLDKSLEKLSRNLGQAAFKTGAQRDALIKLELSASKIAKLPLDQSFLIIGQALSELKNNTDRSRVATDLFGKSGLQMINLFQAGAAPVMELGKRLEETGGVMAEKMIRESESANDAVNTLTKSMSGLAAAAVANFTPEIKAAADTMVEWQAELRGTKKSMVEILKTFDMGSASVAELEGLQKQLTTAIKKTGEAIADEKDDWFVDDEKIAGLERIQTAYSSLIPKIGLLIEAQQKEEKSTEGNALAEIRKSVAISNTEKEVKKATETFAISEKQQSLFTSQLTKQFEAAEQAAEAVKEGAKVVAEAEEKKRKETLKTAEQAKANRAEVERIQGELRTDSVALAQMIVDERLTHEEREVLEIDRLYKKRVQLATTAANAEAINEKEKNLIILEANKNRIAAIAELERQRMVATMETMAGMAAAVSDQGQAFFEFSKALNVAQAIMNTYQAATKAFAQGGVFGIATGSLMIALGMAKVAKIKSTTFTPSKREVGGPVTKGRPYLVGERGPEMFVPKSAGDVQANAGANTVNIQINAVDTEGFDELLFARRAVIVSVINQAMHRQGKRGLV